MQRPFIATTLALLSMLAFDASVSAAQVMRWGGEHELPTEVEGTGEVTRIDAGNASGYALTSSGSVLAWGNGKYGALGAGSRVEAIARLRRALREYYVNGITTNVGLFRRILEEPEFVQWRNLYALAG